MKVAIIAGKGDFPLYIIEQIKDIFVLCVDQHSSPNLFKKKSETVSLLDPESWIKILKTNNITHVVMAGKFDRPKNIKQPMTEEGVKLFKKIIHLGDNSALNVIEKFFNYHGFEILPIYSIIKDCFFPKGFYLEDQISLNLKDFVKESATTGIDLLNTISRFDVGQSVIVSSKLIYAIEGQEGTDFMIDRVGHIYVQNKLYSDFGPVLIKIPKKNQKINLDLPVIGLDTVKKCMKLGFSALVVSSKGTLIVDLKKVILHIKNNNFCVYAI